MARELLILRHGKSDWSADTDDFHRPIKGRGKRGAQRTAAWLLQQDLVPDHIVSSPAVRAIETARIACNAMGLGRDTVTRDPRIYLATRQELLEVLGACPPKARRIMLVGHNPGLEDLLEFLADKPNPVPANGKQLPTAALARLAMPEAWRSLEAGCARVLDLVRPATLPK
jgi:phosphohistidine phosphatase